IEKHAWEYLYQVLLMAVEAGAQGQTFNSLIFAKIEELKNKINQSNKPIKIVVDGGIKQEQIKDLQKAGVDQIAVGSAVFDADNFKTEFNKLKKELQ
ncbi:MAG TPA: thiamine phosphate synthase, partial [Candidatus Woesebacteria bacterium]|nr:thiamine phosphate synthase [Candidatus Woesebacteria bacterium]